MDDLVTEMERCKTVDDCFECVSVDAYTEDEVAMGWHACMESMFSRFKQVKVFGEDVILEGFDLTGGTAAVALCRKGKYKAKVALESIEFPRLTKVESLWLAC